MCGQHAHTWCGAEMVCATSNDLLSCLTAGAHAEMQRRLCANQGAFAPPRIEYDTPSRDREQVHDRGTTCRARVRD